VFAIQIGKSTPQSPERKKETLEYHLKDELGEQSKEKREIEDSDRGVIKRLGGVQIRGGI